jgi:hypothetical protein
MMPTPHGKPPKRGCHYFKGYGNGERQSRRVGRNGGQHAREKLGNATEHGMKLVLFMRFIQECFGFKSELARANRVAREEPVSRFFRSDHLQYIVTS